jgi:hypothetical protein
MRRAEYFVRGCRFAHIYNDPALDQEDRDAITDILLSDKGHMPSTRNYQPSTFRCPRR